MLGFKHIAAAALLAQGVFGEGIHLFNCRPYGAAGSPQTWLSVVAVRELVRPDRRWRIGYAQCLRAS